MAATDLELLRYLFNRGELIKVNDTTYRSPHGPLNAQGKRQQLAVTVVRNPQTKEIQTVDFTVTTVEQRTLGKRKARNGAVRR